MGKSLFDTISESDQFEVGHNGETCFFSLPEWVKELDGILENEEALLKWGKENEVLHGLIHNGIAKLLIDLRAVARPVDKAGEKKGERIVQSLIDESENAQERLDNYVLKPIKRPGTTGKAGIKKAAELDVLRNTIRGMILADLADKMIKEILDGQFDSLMVSKALNEVHQELDS